MLELAQLVASWSKDPSTKVGCVIVRPDTARPLSIGYNGLARGSHDDHWLAEMPRAERLRRTIHAEANAVAAAAAEGVSIGGSIAFVTHHPCAQCANLLHQAGVIAAHCPKPEQGFAKRWAEDMSLARQVLRITEHENI